MHYCPLNHQKINKSSMMRFICIVALICLIIVQVISQVHPNDVPKRYCGKFLSNRLRLLCKSYNFNGFPNKRIPIIGAIDGEDYQFEQAEEEQRWPFLSNQMANSLVSGGRSKRQSGGVADECCKKPCSINEMLGYCAD